MIFEQTHTIIYSFCRGHAPGSQEGVKNVRRRGPGPEKFCFWIRRGLDSGQEEPRTYHGCQSVSGTASPSSNLIIFRWYAGCQLRPRITPWNLFVRRFRSVREARHLPSIHNILRWSLPRPRATPSLSYASGGRDPPSKFIFLCGGGLGPARESYPHITIELMGGMGPEAGNE